MRPWQLLPFPAPRDYDPSEGDPLYFYRNFIKPMIPDTVRIMDQGLHVDDKAVEALRKTIDKVLASVQERLEANILIKQYQNSRLPEAQRKHAEKATEALRTIDYYLKDYKPGDMVHRTWVVNGHLRKLHRAEDRKDKWTLKDLKEYNIFLNDPFLAGVISKRELKNNRSVVEYMRALAKHKLELWNRPRMDKAQEPVELELFNPGSSPQCKEFFEMMNIAPVAFSKDTGEASWGRNALEEVLQQTDQPDLVQVLEAMIDYSYSAIIKNNFLKAFDSFTIDGVLHGNIKLFGAKSFRPTSNAPNLLNAPSTRSIYAKPLKKCFIAPDGKIILTADLKALEDRGIANLSGDTNKCNLFLEGLDGHSLNACGYFPEEIAEEMGEVDRYNSFNDYVKEFYHRVEELKNAVLDKIRSKSKAPTFKLNYGGYPDADKGGVITQELFDNYHNVLYPGITKYREEYVLPITRKNGYIHLGLGCRMYSSNASQAIRTLNNATVQFWSILTLIAINELNYRIGEENLHNEIQVISTIYDSIYTQVIIDPEIIAWLNETIIEVLTVQWLEKEIVRNEANAEIGLNWADLHRVENHATPNDISEILKEFL